MDEAGDSPLAELIARLGELAAKDAVWRDLLGRVGAELMAIAAEAPVAPPKEAERSAPSPAHRGDVVPAEQAVRMLTIGGPVETAEALGTVEAPPAPAPRFDLGLFERRCRLKAEACDWAERRRRLIDEGADFRSEVQPRDSELLESAVALPDCFLWMASPDAPAASPGAYELLARNFETLADVLQHAREAEEQSDAHPASFERAVDLLAEAQSAVRAAVAATARDRDDYDQKGVHLWLRETTSSRQLFVARHMRIDDPASPEAWSDLASRVEAATAEADQQRRAASQRRKLLGKVRHKASLIQSGEDLDASWRVLVDSVETLLAGGLAPSDRQLRESLTGVLEEAPDWATESEAVRLVAREIDRQLAARPEPREASRPEYNEAVEQLRSMLGGKAVVMIGGDRRPDAEARLREALGLGRLDWLATRPHESVQRFEPYVARPDVAVVVQMILYSSHAFGDIDELCRRLGKPFVRLTGGYNPNQFATRVLAQCSERLATATAS
ncbi:hypothetical protein [Botrimarina hoheduenensis]|uniref:DUF2325 domain-containing protein n=1 Tax=Botrimarina hoheduenensis TaxID=2528000 RepID=A0A5C5WEP5_9BACT|nr:hypothetical protein [Botrimarina hoheduenensis]TWT48977.1 hypothetical protein Pla111_07550 [Botrimarina hoheduenensis]